ncbi:MAG: GspH/FimT family pseudopilin [Pseudomonadales bacterium]|jgi:type IV fimbrial biogenesis protein FimT|nr:GspH/FimT family pseudopilin [Pseudomonadales bacterium]
MRQQHGLTLVELLVTLAVLAILVGVAFPGFQGLLERNNLATTSNALVLAINLARSEAVRTSGVMNLEAVDASTATNEWGPGWRVTPPGGPVVRVFEPIPGGLTLNSDEASTTVQLGSRGGLLGVPDYEFELCTAAQGGVRIRIAATGRVATTDLAPGDCP